MLRGPLVTYSNLAEEEKTDQRQKDGEAILRALLMELFTSPPLENNTARKQMALRIAILSARLDECASPIVKLHRIGVSVAPSASNFAINSNRSVP